MSRWLDLRLHAARWRSLARLLSQLERLVAAMATLDGDREKVRVFRFRLSRLSRDVDAAITALQPALTRAELKRRRRDDEREARTGTRPRGSDAGTDGT